MLTKKVFITIRDLVEKGIKIPEGTEIFNAAKYTERYAAGTYIKHYKSDQVDYHTIKSIGFKSFPISSEDFGILIEVKISKAEILKSLKSIPV